MEPKYITVPSLPMEEKTTIHGWNLIAQTLMIISS